MALESICQIGTQKQILQISQILEKLASNEDFDPMEDYISFFERGNLCVLVVSQSSQVKVVNFTFCSPVLS